MRSGKSFPIMDQYGFLVFALIFAMPFGYYPVFFGIVFIIILTGIMHPLTNIGANRLKLKDVPW